MSNELGMPTAGMGWQVIFNLLPPANGLEANVVSGDRTEADGCDDGGFLSSGENLSSLAFRLVLGGEVVLTDADPVDEVLLFNGFVLVVVEVLLAPRLLLPLEDAFLVLAPRTLATVLVPPSNASSLSGSLTESDISDKESSSRNASESLYNEAVVAADRVFASRVGALRATGAATDSF